MAKPNVLAVDFGTVNTYFCKCPADQRTPVGVDFGAKRDGLASAVLYRKNKKTIVGDAALEEYGDATNQERKDYTLKLQFKPDLAASPDARTSSIDFLQTVLQQAQQENLDLDPAQRNVIFGIPSESDQAFRTALVDVAQQAGYGAVTTVDEPKAALLNHVAHKDIPAANALQGILVVDFGGGTCDFAFMYRGAVRHSWGEMELGGRLFDDLFFQWFLEENPQAHRQMIQNGDEFFVHWSICREMKERFSQTMSRARNETFRKSVGSYGRLTHATWPAFLDRARHYLPSPTFKKHLRAIGVKTGALVNCTTPIDLFDWFLSSLKQGLEKHHIEKNDIRYIIQAGGSSLWPFITEILTAELNIEPHHIMRSDRPYAAIAQGLAILPALQHHFHQTQKKLRRELPAFMTQTLKPSISQNIETVAQNIAETITAELYDQKLRPILLTFRQQGGSVSSLETNLAQTASAFEPRVNQIVQDKMLLLAQTLPDTIRTAVAQWFTQHDLSPPDRTVTVADDPRRDHLDLPDISADMFKNIARLVTGITGLIVAMICGGGGMALIMSGPIGLVIGLVIGVAAGIAGTEAAKRVPVPPVMLKMVLTETKLNSARRKLTHEIAAKITELSSAFDTELNQQITDLVRREIDSLSEINQM